MYAVQDLNGLKTSQATIKYNITMRTIDYSAKLKNYFAF